MTFRHTLVFVVIALSGAAAAQPFVDNPSLRAECRKRDTVKSCNTDDKKCSWHAMLKVCNEYGHQPLVQHCNQCTSTTTSTSTTTTTADPIPRVDPPSDSKIKEIKLLPQSWLSEGKKLGVACYRMSRDGDIWEGNPSTFHQKCDLKGPTLTVVKDKKGYVFGGYLSVSWNWQHFGTFVKKRDPNAWLFTLKNYAQIGPTKIPFKKDAATASGDNYNDRSRWGPEFHGGFYIGHYNGMFETLDGNFQFKNRWQVPAPQVDKFWITGEQKYTPAEIEVYPVV